LSFPENENTNQCKMLPAGEKRNRPRLPIRGTKRYAVEQMGAIPRPVSPLFRTLTMADIFAELQWRGLVYQTTSDDFLPGWLNAGRRTVYSGFDPTADSLHVGSLLPLLTLRRFQKAGHRPIALAGGATGMIGDPSGKSAERTLLAEEQLQANLTGIRSQMELLLDFEAGPSAAMVVNNNDWIGQFGYIEFLRDVGKNFSVNVMMARDSVKTRLEGDSGLSYTEFSYMLLQAYDFVHLNRKFGCELQIGGSDQWGNITAGIDLGRRMDGSQLYGMTCPLLTKSDGSKMGKTESGTVWLSAERTSPYQFYQYWINVADVDAGKCLRFLSEFSQDELRHLDESRLGNPAARESQKQLASSLTRLIHGQDGLVRVEQATRIFFGAEIERLRDDELLKIFADVPSKSLSFDLLDSGTLTLADALVHSGLATSKGDARRAVGEGGVYLNNRRQDGFGLVLTREHLASESTIVLRRGKKKYALLRFV